MAELKGEVEGIPSSFAPRLVLAASFAPVPLPFRRLLRRLDEVKTFVMLINYFTLSSRFCHVKKKINNNNNNNLYYLILRKLTYINDQMRITNITKRKFYVSVIKIN